MPDLHQVIFISIFFIYDIMRSQEPFLFLICINDLPNCILFCEFILFAKKILLCHLLHIADKFVRNSDKTEIRQSDWLIIFH